MIKTVLRIYLEKGTQELEAMLNKSRKLSRVGLLTINFGGSITKIFANGNGRFSQDIVVPDSNLAAIDAKVTGLKSNLSYSTSFNVVKIK